MIALDSIEDMLDGNESEPQEMMDENELSTEEKEPGNVGRRPQRKCLMK